jgi:hypothetical protein
VTAPAPARRPALLGALVAVFALAAVVSGIVLIVRAETVTTSHGWFAYAPLSDTTFTFGAFGRGIVLGTVLIGGGLAGLAFWAGRRAAAVAVRRGRIRPGRLELRRILRVVVPTAAAIVVGAGLLVWKATRSLLGWRDLGPADAGFSVVATKGQYGALTGPWWLGPAVVGAALVIAGVGVLAFAAGRLSARPAASPPAAAPPPSELGSDPEG